LSLAPRHRLRAGAGRRGTQIGRRFQGGLCGQTEKRAEATEVGEKRQQLGGVVGMAGDPAGRLGSLSALGSLKVVGDDPIQIAWLGRVHGWYLSSRSFVREIAPKIKIPEMK